jgi:hypothetical protein
MRFLRLLLCVAGLSCAVSALRAQDTYYVNGTGAIGLLQQSFSGGFTLNTPQIQAVADACFAVSASVQNHGNTLVGALGTITASAVQMQQIAHATSTNLSTLTTNLSALSAALNASAGAMTAASSQVTTAATTMSTAANGMAVAINNFTTSAGGLGTTISTAINTQGAAAQFDQLQLRAKLDGIKDVLLTNGYGSNTFTLNATNGDVALTVTNNINVALPDLSEVSMTAYRTRTNAEALPPSDHTAETQAAVATANDSTPDFGVAVNGYVPVAVAGFSPNFLRLELPAFFGNAVSIDLNPWTMHEGAFQGVFTWFRRAIAWAGTLLFLIKCAQIADQYFIAMGAVGQVQTPRLQVLGTNLGKLAWPIYKVTFIALALAFQSGVTLMLTGASGLGIEAVNGPTGGLAGLVAGMTRDVYVGLAPDVIALLDKVFPLAMLVSQLLFLLTCRFPLWVAWWVFKTAVRLLPA